MKKMLWILVTVLSFLVACTDKSPDRTSEASVTAQVAKKEVQQGVESSSYETIDQNEQIVKLPATVLAEKLSRGDLSAEQVTQAFLQRIEAIDKNGPQLNAVIELNPDALAIARALDNKFSKDRTIGRLHGVPVLLKANIDTNDNMATSAGSSAMQSNYPSKDSPLVANLRAAGAVILGKTNLSEWANFRSTHSSSGWSSLGGQTKNPYVLDRNPCGSSSGSAVAVAAYLAPLAVGTETDGSVVCPSSINGVVGLKPTVGRVSAAGIIPISHTQDTAGPMATTVAGVELLYQVMHGLSLELPQNEIKLQGLRVGVWRDYYGAENNPEVTELFFQAISHLEKNGAVIVDVTDIEDRETVNPAEYEVLLYEFKDGLNNYLKASDDSINFFTLENLIEFNSDNAEEVMPYFAQEIFEKAQAKGDLNSPEYKKALQDSHFAMQEVLRSTFANKKIDVLIAPTNQPAWKTDWENGDDFMLSSSGPAAISGFPNITVPMGHVDGLPIGLSLMGLDNDDEKLIEIAKRFEALSKARTEPGFIESLE